MLRAVPVLLLLVGVTTPSLVKRLSPLVVRQGRQAYVHTGALQFTPMKEGEQCKVEVVTNDPMTQRVGTLKPTVFDCHYAPYTITYMHNGSPLLDDDQLKLRVYHFTSEATSIEVVYLPVQIQKAPHDIFVDNTQKGLEVEEFFGMSNTIDSTVLRFRYNYYNGASCVVSFSQPESQLPLLGNVVHGSDNKVVNSMTHDCRDFLFMGLRYEHMSPPTPDTDYLPLAVEVNDPMQADEPMKEHLYLPITIKGAFPNVPPRASFLSSYIMEVDEFVLHTLDPEVMSAQDSETPDENLIFNISKPPGPSEGYFVHLEDHTKSITSFLQADLINHNIAYQPPNVSYPHKKVLEVEFLAYDSHFAASEPILLHIAIRPSSSIGPRVTINVGLTLIEGQSRPITSKELQIVDRDNPEQVEVHIKGGLRHGSLLVNRRPAMLFTPEDIEEGLVVYRHDDSDTAVDRIVLRITDGLNTIRTKFPINILPKDDSAPYVINNRGLQVGEGAYVQITPDLLSAHDKDSDDDDITFLIRTPPKAGEIVKRFRPMTKGTLIPKFTLLELKRGYIYYHHLGGESMQDLFEFILLDKSDPPNKSGKYVIDISVTAVDDMPPRQVSGTSRQMTVRETEVAYILQEQLHYEDSETDSEDLVYTITSQPFFLTTTITIDAGRIISTDGLVELTKDPEIPPVHSFTQSEVNHHKIAYMPPIEDVGHIRRHAQFIFAVSDSKGNKIMDQIFDITILPVNNQLPHMSVSTLEVQEGGGVVITANELSAYDPDTDQSDLWFTLEEPPTHGHLLMLENEMPQGDRFQLHDIKLSNIRYVHGGTEAKEDSFVVSISDSRHKLTKMVPILVHLLDDELPQAIDNLQTGLQVLEHGDVVITTENLGAVDNDTDDEDLMFSVWKSPEFGSIELGNHRTSEFSQYDLKQNSVRYVHTAGEVGPEPKEDTALFNVYDLGSPGRLKSSLMELHFTIVPVDTEAPELILGSPLVAEEGEKVLITVDALSAQDLDTLEETLTFIVTKPPRWGFLENVKPLPGSEIRRAGIPVNTFNMKDLIDQTINYVQSNHSDVEPVRDTLELYVTDGQRISERTWLDINILPKNDELPKLRLGDLVVDEGGEKVVDPVEIDGHDVDNREEKLMLSVDKPPRHGHLSLMTKDHGRMQETPMHDVSMHDVHYKMHLKYKHDGSENYRDQFTLKLSDGKHSTKGTSKIKVMPINDESPQLLTNAGFSVRYGGQKTLSRVVLKSTDTDNPETELYYIIIKPPQQGLLERLAPQAKSLGDEEYWVVLKSKDNFTQHEVDMNNVRYTHTGGAVDGDTAKDGFIFQLTDGMNSLLHESFNIDIVETGEEDLALLNMGLSVKEGDSHVINTAILSATDNTDRPQDIKFVVTSSPMQGRLEMIGAKDVPITEFSQLDLAAQKVVYIHTEKGDALSDAFQFSVINSMNHSRTAVFHISILAVDQALPSLLANMPLTVLQGEEVVLTTSNLLISDPDTPSSNLTYTVVETPRHGGLLKQDIPMVTKSFSQLDIDMGFIKYKSNKSDDSGNFDFFLFTVSDGHHDGYLSSNSTVLTKPVFFNILIQPRTQEPPRMIHKKSPTQLEYMTDDKYSYVLTDQHLKAVHAGSDSIDLLYIITEKPEHGYLYHLGTKRMVRKRFTQKDIDDGKVLFVVEGSFPTNNDSFAFRVQNGFGNSLPEQRLYLEWSIVELQELQYIVCEDAGTIVIPVIRWGNLNESAFVEIRTKDMSAKEGMDFESSRVAQLQFDPGSNKATWEVTVIADQLEEPNEKMKVLLRQPINTVIGQQDKSIITLINLKNGRCEQYIGMITKDDQFPMEELPPFSSIKSKDSTLTNFHGLMEIPEADLDTSADKGRDFDIFDAGLQYLAENEGRDSFDDMTQGFHGSDDDLEIDLSQLHPLELYRRQQEEEAKKRGSKGGGKNRNGKRKNGRKNKKRTGKRKHTEELPLAEEQADMLNSMPGETPTVAPQSCTGETKDLLYFDLASSNMYRCNGRHWEKVGWGPNYMHTAMLRDASAGAYSSQEEEDQAKVDEEKVKDGEVVVDDIKPVPTLEEGKKEGCPEEWERYKSRCYKVMGAKQTWQTAEDNCKELGAHLADVTSDTHLLWLWQLVHEQPFWIGLNDIEQDDKWVYTTGEDAQYFNWKKRFPRKRNSDSKNCVLVGKRSEWVNRPCDEKRAKYLCSLPFRTRRKRGPARRYSG